MRKPWTSLRPGEQIDVNGTRYRVLKMTFAVGRYNDRPDQWHLLPVGSREPMVGTPKNPHAEVEVIEDDEQMKDAVDVLSGALGELRELRQS